MDATARRNDSRPEAPKARLLYDKDFLGEVMDEANNCYDVKDMMKTTATAYEIRTAVEYWFGGQADHRTSDRIWSHCEAVDSGEWVVDEETDELRYAEVDA